MASTTSAVLGVAEVIEGRRTALSPTASYLQACTGVETLDGRVVTSPLPEPTWAEGQDFPPGFREDATIKRV